MKALFLALALLAAPLGASEVEYAEVEMYTWHTVAILVCREEASARAIHEASLEAGRLGWMLQSQLMQQPNDKRELPCYLFKRVQVQVVNVIEEDVAKDGVPLALVEVKLRLPKYGEAPGTYFSATNGVIFKEPNGI